MKLHFVAILLALSGGASADNGETDPGLLHEHLDVRPDGSRVLVQQRNMATDTGQPRLIEYHLTVESNGDRVYRYAEQGEEMKRFHEASCAKEHSRVSDWDMIINGGGAGWGCIRDEHPSASDRSDRSTDYILHDPPRGRVPVGSPFQATGIVQYRSSVGGSIQVTIAVDGSRCVNTTRGLFTVPFSGSYTAKVDCIINQPSTVKSLLHTCIPRACNRSDSSMTAG